MKPVYDAYPGFFYYLCAEVCGALLFATIKGNPVRTRSCARNGNLT